MLRPDIDYCHPTSNARRVRSLPAQSHFNSRRGGIVAQDGGRAAKAIDHDVEIAVAVEIGECHAVRDVRAEVEAPARARVFEGEIEGRLLAFTVVSTDDSTQAFDPDVRVGDIFEPGGPCWTETTEG